MVHFRAAKYQRTIFVYLGQSLFTEPLSVITVLRSQKAPHQKVSHNMLLILSWLIYHCLNSE